MGWLHNKIQRSHSFLPKVTKFHNIKTWIVKTLKDAEVVKCIEYPSRHLLDVREL